MEDPENQQPEFNENDDDNDNNNNNYGQINQNEDEEDDFNQEIEDEDDDFPEYANEQNKQLNQIIKEKKRLIKEIDLKLEEKKDRTKILNDHYKNVQAELLHIQNLTDQKNKEIETEDHMKQLAERQIGRLESELRKLDKLGIEQQEKLNDVQTQIFRGNEKLDQQKLQMNWNQEELEQWALAARQKEEDNITLEKYKRIDENKIKELNLQIERYTMEVSRNQKELEREITETQAAQIELDKTAEEFKKNHQQRHKYFEQWKEVCEIISKRDKAIVEEGENFAKIKMEINQNKIIQEEKKLFLTKQKRDNKAKDTEIQILERGLISDRADIKQIQEQLENLDADVEILKNQLSAFAQELSQKKQKRAKMEQDLDVKKQRLNAAQKKYQNQEIKIKNEDVIGYQYKTAKEIAEGEFKQNRDSLNELEKKIRQQKDSLFKQTQDLFKLRENEANLYGEIQGIMSACRNLQAHINKKNQEFQRQQELLYNAEYQIQLMERKVSRAKGIRNFEEKRELEEEIAQLQVQVKEVETDHKLLIDSIKKLDDDIRKTEKIVFFFKLFIILIQLVDKQQSKVKYQGLIDELSLENDNEYQYLQTIVKHKEEELVRVDCMKLEIRKIQEKLNFKIDTVFTLENRKYQLEQSMQEREKEIYVHKDVLLAEVKAAEEERHKIAVELAERKNKVKNLKIKYESLVQRNKASNGEVETVNEHSQAYFVIKAAQEREELQRKGDELNAKIVKSEKELKALNNTKNHLSIRNSNQIDKFLNKGITQKDFEHRDGLEEQCKAASKNLFSKEKELQKIQKDSDEDRKRLAEIQNKIEILNQQKSNLNQQLEKSNKELIEQQNKLERAQKQYQIKFASVKQLKLDITEENPHIIQMNLDIETNKNKTLIASIYNISQEFPELSNILEQNLNEKQIKMPSRPQSQIDEKSQKSFSGASHSSKGSRISQGSKK